MTFCFSAEHTRCFEEQGTKQREERTSYRFGMTWDDIIFTVISLKPWLRLSAVKE